MKLPLNLRAMHLSTGSQMAVQRSRFQSILKETKDGMMLCVNVLKDKQVGNRSKAEL